MSIHLQRRSHTRKVLPILPQIDEELEEMPALKPKRRPRPTPIVTPFQMQPADLDVLKSTQTLTFLDKDPEFSLSPSLLLTRRKSETVLDFPVPPKIASQAATAVPALSSPTRYSPTPSTSSNSSSSSYPNTPVASDSEEAPENNDFSPASTPSSVRRQPYRTTSALSLKSFGTSEFDAQAAPIYALLRAPPASPPPSAPLPRRPELRQEVKALRNLTSLESIVEDWIDVDCELVRIPREATDEVKRRPSLVLTVQDDASLEIPFVIDGNFLDIDLSDEDNEDCCLFDGLEFEFDESHIARLPAFTPTGGFASSDEESDDGLRRPSLPSPSRVQDPDLARQAGRRGAISQAQFLLTPPVSSAASSPASSLLSAPVPSPAPSTKSSFLSRLAIPPRESIVPRDIDIDDLFSPVEDIRMSVPVPVQIRPPSPKPVPPPKLERSLVSPIMFTSPFTSLPLSENENDADADDNDNDNDDEPAYPILRSRFSTSTLNSVMEQPRSPKLALASPSKFFSRLLGSNASPSASKLPPTPPKTPSRSPTQPLRYRKPTPIQPPHGTIILKHPKTSPPPPGRRASKSLELYDRPPVSPTCSSPIPFDKDRTERYYNYYQKHQSLQRGLSSTTKRFPSRSSLDTTYSMESSMSGSGESTLSAGSSSSTGLKRRPIPVELFIKH